MCVFFLLSLDSSTILLRIKRMSRLKTFAKKNPVSAASISLCIKYAVADTLVQKATCSQFDLDRFLMMSGWGMYYGFVNFFVFRRISRVKYKTFRRKIAASTFLDTCIHLPCFFFPQFYVFQSLVYEKRLSLSKSIARWKENFADDFRNCLMVWVPLDLIMFTYIPLHLRTPFVASAGLIWPILMSFKRGSRE